MPVSVARGTLEKARYFLAQAKQAERRPTTSADRVPFLANLEAAIIYGRSILQAVEKTPGAQ
jgi:hypothetical protein